MNYYLPLQRSRLWICGQKRKPALVSEQPVFAYHSNTTSAFVNASYIILKLIYKKLLFFERFCGIIKGTSNLRRMTVTCFEFFSEFLAQGIIGI